MAKKDYVRYINSLLNENTEQSKQELSDLFADEEFRKNDMLEEQYVYTGKKNLHILKKIF